MKKVCVVVGSRANYSSIKSALQAMETREDIQLSIVIAASALLDRFGDITEIVRKDGFEISDRVHLLVEGDTPGTMAQSAGLGILLLAPVLARIAPDYVLTVGDRFETICTTIAAAYLGIHLVHTMGGEVSGNIDEHVRHAVTKFAHVHFPATELASRTIVSLGEDPNRVFLVGCPRIDLALEAKSSVLSNDLFAEGVGDAWDLDASFLMVAQHPVTSEYGSAEVQITETLGAAGALGLPTIVLWPNSDAGSEDLARGLRKWREQGFDNQMHFFKNLEPTTYLRLLSQTACLIGNSSSGLREGAFLGTPVVNIGSRQVGRERATNVIDVGYDKDHIEQAAKQQLNHGPYPSSDLYGIGNAGSRIAEILSSLAYIPFQKRLIVEDG